VHGAVRLAERLAGAKTGLSGVRVAEPPARGGAPDVTGWAE
jgi:hypothetical protein